MVLKLMSFGELADKAELTDRVMHVRLVPQENPVFFWETWFSHRKTLTLKNSYIVGLSDYIMQGVKVADYDNTNFMLSPEQALLQAKDNLKKEFSITLNELIANSMMWGNEQRKDLPLYLSLYEGRKGKVFRLEDSGEGFDYHTIPENRPKVGGMGFLRIRSVGETICYEGKGNVVNVLLYI